MKWKKVELFHSCLAILSQKLNKWKPGTWSPLFSQRVRSAGHIQIKYYVRWTIIEFGRTCRNLSYSAKETGPS